MSKAPYRKQVDCPPTLTDQDVIDFCRNGYLMLPGVVPDDINHKVVDYLDHADGTYEPTPIMEQPWFVDQVLMNTQAAGAVRSLLGQNFTLPILISNHRGPLPYAQSHGWHRDGGSIYTSELEYLQVFYYPEECTIEMGPTELLPGSHFMRTKAPLMSHMGSIKGAVSSSGPAGTIFLTVYSIWHRRSRAISGPKGISKYRNLLKYNYWRTEPPTRDWVTDQAIDFSRIDFNPPGVQFEQFHGGIAAAEMFAWLSGLKGQYKKHGGQGWPIANTVRDRTNQFGVPGALENG
jgi:hypothetical protein